MSTVTVILVIGIGVCIVMNPLISVSLTGALLAVAAIIRAIAGSPVEPSDPARSNHRRRRTPESGRRGGWLSGVRHHLGHGATR